MIEKNTEKKLMQLRSLPACIAGPRELGSCCEDHVGLYSSLGCNMDCSCNSAVQRYQWYRMSGAFIGALHPSQTTQPLKFLEAHTQSHPARLPAMKSNRYQLQVCWFGNQLAAASMGRIVVPHFPPKSWLVPARQQCLGRHLSQGAHLHFLSESGLPQRRKHWISTGKKPVWTEFKSIQIIKKISCFLGIPNL